MRLSGYKIRKFLLDVLFPIRCLGCSREGEWVCGDCVSLLQMNTFCSCPVCKQENSVGRVCGYCKKSTSLDGLLIVLENNDLSSEVIHYLKYNFVIDLLDDLKPKIDNFLNKNPFWRDFYVLVPVPLERKKFLKRGFNQSRLIAKVISSVCGNRIDDDLLLRVGKSHAQVGYGADVRHRNILGHFKVCREKIQDLDKMIFLVDDVYTTGSTMGECARVLKEVGYKKVWGIVVVRG